MSVVNIERKRISDSWYSRNNASLQCPAPGCTHKGDIITKLHCRNVHGMERDDVKERYGMPIVVSVKSGFGGASNSNLWNSTSNNSGNLI